MTTVARYEPGVWAFYHSATFLTIVQCTFYRCYNQLIHIDPPTHQYRKEVAASRQVLYMSGVISLAVCSNNQIRHNCFGRSLISQQSCLCRYYHECSWDASIPIPGCLIFCALIIHCNHPLINWWLPLCLKLAYQGGCWKASDHPERIQQVSGHMVHVMDGNISWLLFSMLYAILMNLYHRVMSDRQTLDSQLSENKQVRISSHPTDITYHQS